MNVRNIIQDYIDLLIKCDFKKFYNILGEMINLDSLSDIGKVTSYLMSIGIDPMEYMSEIPNYYLYESDIDYIRIPSNIKRINSDAFNGCPRLSNVFIEDSVEFISDGAFSYCEQLKFITLPKQLQQISPNTFYKCISLQSVQVSPSVSSIGAEAFAYCLNLERVEIPTSVTRIEEGAFKRCPALQQINYLGTRHQWEDILKDKPDVSYTQKIICTDGTITLAI